MLYKNGIELKENFLSILKSKIVNYSNKVQITVLTWNDEKGFLIFLFK